jgi:hypothetical protein
MAYENITKDGNFYQSVTGDYGFRVLDAAESSVAGENFRAIQALEGSSVTTTTSVGDALSAVTLAEGSIVYGRFDSVTCNSGKVIAYKGA